LPSRDGHRALRINAHYDVVDPLALGRGASDRKLFVFRPLALFRNGFAARFLL